MLSRCPACDTVFRVGREQLAARQGLVRCGRCSEVFNARWHPVHGPRRDEPGSRRETPAVAGDGERHSLEAAIAAGEGGTPNVAEPAAAPRRPRRLAASSAPPPGKPPAPAAAQPPDPSPVDSRAREVAQRSDVVPAAAGTPASVPQQREDTASVAPGEADVQLVQVHVPDRRRILAMRALVVALFVLLGVQLVHYHGPRMLEFDGVRALGDRACAWLGCEVPPRRAVDAWSVAGARVTAFAEEPDALQVEVHLVNRAPFPQPAPHLEVTLSDRLGRAVARRVFDPPAYLSGNRILHEPGVLADGSLVLAGPPAAALGFEVRVVDPGRVAR